jgi:hypothetical protein
MRIANGGGAGGGAKDRRSLGQSAPAKKPNENLDVSARFTNRNISATVVADVKAFLSPDNG